MFPPSVGKYPTLDAVSQHSRGLQKTPTLAVMNTSHFTTKAPEQAPAKNLAMPCRKIANWTTIQQMCQKRYLQCPDIEVEVEATTLAQDFPEQEVGALEREGQETEQALEEVVEAVAKEVAIVAIREIHHVVAKACSGGGGEAGRRSGSVKDPPRGGNGHDGVGGQGGRQGRRARAAP
jgi:hypothetical protein